MKQSAWLAPTASIAVVILLWEVLEHSLASPHPAIPAPSAIAAAVLANSRVLWLSLQPTVFEAVCGFALGSSAGVLLAIALFAGRSAESALYKVVVTIHSVPLLAIAPLLVIWMGIGSSPVITLAALACFFPTTVNVHTGLQAVGAADLDLMQSINANAWAVLVHLRLPAALPYLLSAMKIGAPSAVLGTTIGEWLGSHGLGYVMFSSMVNFQPPLLWAAMLLSALLSLTGFAVFAVLERALVSWHESLRTTE